MSIRDRMKGLDFIDNESGLTEELFEDEQSDPDMEGKYSKEFQKLGILKRTSNSGEKKRLPSGTTGPEDPTIRENLINKFLKEKQSGKITNDAKGREIHNNLIPIDDIPESVKNRMKWLMEIIGNLDEPALYKTEVENINGKSPYYFCAYFKKIKILVIFNQRNEKLNYIIRDCDRINEFKKIGPDLFHAYNLRSRILDIRTQLQTTWKNKVAKFIGFKIEESPGKNTKSKYSLAEKKDVAKREENES